MATSDQRQAETDHSPADEQWVFLQQDGWTVKELLLKEQDGADARGGKESILAEGPEGARDTDTLWSCCVSALCDTSVRDRFWRNKHPHVLGAVLCLNTVVHVLSALALLAGYEVLEEWLAVAKHATAATLNGAVFCFVARFLTLSTIKASKVVRPGVADVLFRLLGTNAAVSLAAWIMTGRDVAAVYRVFRDRPEIVVWHPLLEAKLGVLLARIPLGVSLAFITLFEIDCAFRACAVYCTSMERERKASAERTLQPGHLVDADPSSRSPSTTIGVCGAMLHWIVKYQYPKGLQRTALPGFTAPAARRHLGSGTRLKRSNLEKAGNGDI